MPPHNFGMESAPVVSWATAGKAMVVCSTEGRKVESRMSGWDETWESVREGNEWQGRA